MKSLVAYLVVMVIALGSLAFYTCSKRSSEPQENRMLDVCVDKNKKYTSCRMLLHDTKEN